MSSDLRVEMAKLHLARGMKKVLGPKVRNNIGPLVTLLATRVNPVL
jgi:hypothetical protein